MKKLLFSVPLLLFFFSSVEARDQIKIVGSSTVYPFTTAVAEQYGKNTSKKAPVVESTGTGGGMKLFCSGVGITYPDFVNASRAMKLGEFEECRKNGVTDILQIKIGIDGLVIAQSKNGTPLKLSMEQIFLALAEKVPDKNGNLIPNPYKNWSDLNSALPNVKIEVLGPPPTSGTRDSFHELFMEVEAKENIHLSKLAKENPKEFEKLWKSIRKDGAFIEAGENDNVIVQKLETNKNAFGIFGYSFLEENLNKLRGVVIDGVEPNEVTISSGKYKGSRPLYIYAKVQHFSVIPGMKEFIQEFLSTKAVGKDGYLARKGLVPLSSLELSQITSDVRNNKILTTSDFK